MSKPSPIDSSASLHIRMISSTARDQLDKKLAKNDWLKPVAAEMIVGKYDPTALRRLDKLIAKPKASPLHGLAAHDDRDWKAIEKWATSLG